MEQPQTCGEVEKELVSVIVPTYNRAAFLEEAVRSIYAQTYRPVECIVVDDGSKDDTDDVMKRMEALRDDRFFLLYLKQPNSGAQTARNTGTKAARGAFIQYLDSDDLLYPDKLQLQINYLLQHKHCDAVFGNWESGSPASKYLVEAYAGDDLVKQMLTLERSIANFSILMRRELIEQIGPWDVTMKRCQEIDYHLRGLMKGAVYHYQSITTGLWRYHENERIHNQTGLDAFCIFYSKWEAILKEKRLFTTAMGEKIADWYMWFLTQTKQPSVEKLLPVLLEAVRLKPSLPFYNTAKMRTLRVLFGKRTAVKMWLTRYVKTM